MCFFPQGRMSLSGMLISRIEDGENLRNAFEISGALFIQTTVGFTCSAPLFKSTSVSELSLKNVKRILVLKGCSSFSFVCASLLYFLCCCAGSHNERMQVACDTQQDLQDWLDLLTKHTHTPAPHTPSYKHQSVCHTVRAEDFFHKYDVHIVSWWNLQVKSVISVSASCPLSLALPSECQSHTAGAQGNCTTLFPTHPLLGQLTATV